MDVRLDCLQFTIFSAAITETQISTPQGDTMKMTEAVFLSYSIFFHQAN
jgi:hypothetical protein